MHTISERCFYLHVEYVITPETNHWGAEESTPLDTVDRANLRFGDLSISTEKLCNCRDHPYNYTSLRSRVMYSECGYMDLNREYTCV